jgi:predicted dehydrogenase
MIGFSHRMNNSNKVVKEILERGDIGNPFMIRVRFAHNGPFPGWAKSDWFYKPELAGGGALFDMGIHAIDLCNWMIGKVTTVTAEMSALRKPIAVDDNAVMTLKFGDRAMGYIEVGWTSGPGFLGLEIYGDNGSIINDYNAPLRICTGKSTPDPSEVVMEWSEVEVPKTADSWAVEMDYFMDTIIKGDIIPIDISAGMDALAVALAAMQSAKSGERVYLNCSSKV